MWICLNEAFFSIVAHLEEEGCVLVRARNGGDIEKYWPSADIVTDEGVDYQQRAVIPRYQVAGVLFEYILNDLQHEQCQTGNVTNLTGEQNLRDEEDVRTLLSNL
jgi:hypothetical protein